MKHPNEIVAEELVEGFGTIAAAPAMTGPAFETIKTVNAEVYGVTTAPSLMIGGTDTKHYLDLCDEVYRHSPLHMNMKDLSMFHGETGLL